MFCIRAVARAASRCVRRRRLTFLGLERAHHIIVVRHLLQRDCTIAKRSCSINYQPRNCVDEPSVSAASRRLDKDG